MSSGMLGTTIAVFGGSSPNMSHTSRDHHQSSGNTVATNAEGSGREPGGMDSVDGLFNNGATTDSQKIKAACDRLQSKINRTKLLIQREQAANEKNVREYLALTNLDNLSSSPSSSNGASGISSRVKAEFEKKNQKSAHTIAQLQRKLEDYSSRLQEARSTGRLRRSGASSAHIGHTHRPAKNVLKDVGHGLKELFARDVARSRDASPCESRHSYETKQLRTAAYKTKSNSLENMISSTKCNTNHVNDSEHRSADGKECMREVRGEISDEDASHSSILSDSASGENHVSPPRFLRMQRPSTEPQVRNYAASSNAGRPCDEYPVINGDKTVASGVLSEGNIDALVAELRDNQEIQRRLQETFDKLKAQYDEENSAFRQTLEEERDRCERLEEQLNDLGELHQNEILNIKQELASMQEKIEYQLDERTRDMHELLESCQTKISKMEMQQQHNQQLISMEGIENSNFRAILTKLINVMLAILAVVLVLVSTLANVLGPFLSNRFRIISTVCLVACVVAAWDNWPVLCDIFDRFTKRYGLFKT